MNLQRRYNQAKQIADNILALPNRQEIFERIDELYDKDKLERVSFLLESLGIPNIEVLQFEGWYINEYNEIEKGYIDRDSQRFNEAKIEPVMCAFYLHLFNKLNFPDCNN